MLIYIDFNGLDFLDCLWNMSAKKKRKGKGIDEANVAKALIMLHLCDGYILSTLVSGHFYNLEKKKFVLF